MLIKLGLFFRDFEVYFLGLVAFQELRKLYCCICIYYISQEIEIDFKKHNALNRKEPTIHQW